MVIALLLLACGGSEPEPDTPMRRAVDAWRAGETALEAGEATDAVAAFELALDAQPDDPLLMAWRAKALADAGSLDEAIAVGERVIQLRPTFAAARYNLAAWFARAGRPDDAAIHLRRALADGAASPRDVLRDEDFSEVIGTPAFDFLPRAQLEARLAPLPESAFWGSEVTLRFHVEGIENDAPSVRATTLDGPIRLVSVVEDVVGGDEPSADLSWTFRVVGEGQVAIGPFEVRAGERTVDVPAIALSAAAPPGKSAPEESVLSPLRTPRQVAGAWEQPHADREGGDLWVMGLRSDRVAVEPPTIEAPIWYEFRLDGQPRWRVEQYVGAAAASVSLRRNGAVVLTSDP